ncbi:hypothetical protein DsansV1_C24g0181301 [Dioscorea sansibarensis]
MERDFFTGVQKNHNLTQLKIQAKMNNCCCIEATISLYCFFYIVKEKCYFM